MNQEQEQTNVVEFKKRKHLNIGLIIFGIIFVYLIATIVMYLTAPRVTVYEVRQGSILKDTAYTGLALREEMVVNASKDGYINYYMQDSNKVRVGSKVYTLSEQKLNFSDKESAEESELSAKDEQEVIRTIQKYNYDYKDNHFSETYRLKTDLKDTLGSMNSQSKLEQLDEYLASGNREGIEVYKAKEDGVVVYTLDGMEDLTPQTATLAHLSRDSYRKTELSNNIQVHAGDPVYKIVTNDEWTLLIDLDLETARALQEKKYVKVHFTKDDQEMWANLKLEETEGHHLAYLTFETAMVRYATERYLHVELILEDETGLKIPKTAKTEKEFYVVPKTYITQGGNSSDYGVLVQTKDAKGNPITAFETTEIYYEDDEVVYLDPNDFSKDAVLVMPDSDKTYTLSETGKLEGVFCINRGYAMFKQITILCESDSYYIVKEGTNYGLSNYDHIALDSSNIKENDVVF